MRSVLNEGYQLSPESPLHQCNKYDGHPLTPGARGRVAQTSVSGTQQEAHEDEQRQVGTKMAVHSHSGTLTASLVCEAQQHPCVCVCSLLIGRYMFNICACSILPGASRGLPGLSAHSQQKQYSDYIHQLARNGILGCNELKGHVIPINPMIISSRIAMDAVADGVHVSAELGSNGSLKIEAYRLIHACRCF